MWKDIASKITSQSLPWSVVGFLLGVIGAMGMQNSYISEIQSKSLELQSKSLELQQLLRQVEQSKSEVSEKAENAIQEFVANQKATRQKIDRIESILLSKEKISIYNELPSAMSLTEIKSIEFIKNSKNSKQDKQLLLELMFRADSEYIATLAAEKFYYFFESSDVDFTIELLVTNDNVSFNKYTFVDKLSKKIKHTDIKILESAILRHFPKAKSELYCAGIFEFLYRGRTEEKEIQSLNNLLVFFNEKGLKESERAAKELIYQATDMIKYK